MADPENKNSQVIKLMEIFTNLAEHKSLTEKDKELLRAYKIALDDVLTTNAQQNYQSLNSHLKALMLGLEISANGNKEFLQKAAKMLESFIKPNIEAVNKLKAEMLGQVQEKNISPGNEINQPRKRL